MKVAIGLFFLLFCMAPRVWAQSNMYTADSYDDYGSYDDGNGGMIVYIDATVEGQVYVAHAPQGAEHTYSVYTRLNGTPMTQSEGPTSDYVCITNSQQVDASPGETVSYNEEDTVVCNMMGPIYDYPYQLTFVPVFLSINYTSPLHSDDAASFAYEQAFGTTVTGPLISLGSLPGCAMGYEEIAKGPSTNTVDIPITRTIVSQQIYQNSTYAGGGPGPDPDHSQYVDSDPQSGGSDGVAYVVDGPGGTPDPFGDVLRMRTNFVATVTYASGTSLLISNPVEWFARSSCVAVPGSYTMPNDIPGDDQIGYGTTPTSWNLQ